MDVVLEKTDWKDRNGVYLIRTLFNPDNTDALAIPEELYRRYQSGMTEFEHVQVELYKYSEGINIHYEFQGAQQTKRKG